MRRSAVDQHDARGTPSAPGPVGDRRAFGAHLGTSGGSGKGGGEPGRLLSGHVNGAARAAGTETVRERRYSPRPLAWASGRVVAATPGASRPSTTKLMARRLFHRMSMVSSAR